MLLGLLGFISTSGWLIGRPELSRLGLDAAPLTLDSSLAFMLLGAALIALHRGRRRWAGAAALLLLPLPISAGLFYVSGIDLNLQDIMGRLTRGPLTNPAHIPPNSAFLLLLTSLTLSLLARERCGYKTVLFGSLSGSLVASIGLLSFIGYFTGIRELYHWTGHSAMAFPAALGFFLLGIAVVATSLTSLPKRAGGRQGNLQVSLHLPLTLFIGNVICVTFLWNALAAHDRYLIEEGERSLLQSLKAALAARLEHEVADLSVVGLLWDAGAASPTRRDTVYLPPFISTPGIVSAAWADSTGRIRRMGIPREQIAAPFKRPIADISHDVFEMAVPQKKITAFRPPSPMEKSPMTPETFFLSIPVSDGERFYGWIQACFAEKEFLSATVGKLISPGQSMLVMDAERRPVYDFHFRNEPLNDAQAGETEWHGLKWNFEISPPNQSPIGSDGLRGMSGLTATLLVGIVFSALSAGTIHYFQQARIRAHQAESANSELHEEFERRKAKEAELRQKTLELKAANQELETFSYSVSHDLKAPLRRIEGFSQSLLKKYRGQLDERGGEYLCRILNGSRNMSLLIDALLNFSRISNANLSRKEVDVSDLSLCILAEFRETEPLRRVEINVERNLIVRADPTLVQGVLRNLLSNAWKFTRAKNDGAIQIGSMEAEGERFLFIKDNGVGFDMPNAYKLFEAFQRLHHASEFPGTGIGLATVQRIINRHGGSIRAEAKVNQGATFYFNFGCDSFALESRSEKSRVQLPAA